LKTLTAVVVGSYVQDHVWRTAHLPKPGESRIGSFATGPGGKGFNQAVALARQLDHPGDVHFIGALGADTLALSAKVAGSKFGLSTLWFEKLDATAAASVMVDANGANLICVALGANAQLDQADIDAALNDRARTQGQPAVLVVQLEIALSATHAALSFAKQHGVRSILNPAPINLGVTAELLALADIITPNETEFAFLLAHLHGTAISLVDFDDDSVMHRSARVLSAGTVIITLGAAGAFVSHGAHQHGDRAAFYRLPAEPAHAVDTTGAGDAFTGGLAAASLRFPNTTFSEWVKHAMRVAALSVETEGAANAMPSFSDVQTRFGAIAC
jgi:ribokinase